MLKPKITTKVLESIKGRIIYHIQGTMTWLTAYSSSDTRGCKILYHIIKMLKNKTSVNQELDIHWIYPRKRKVKYRCKRICHLYTYVVRNAEGRRSQDGRGIGRGDHFLFYKFIERTTERWRKFTKQLLIASRGHQAPRKAAHYLRREVWQKY